MPGAPGAGAVAPLGVTLTTGAWPPGPETLPHADRLPTIKASPSWRRRANGLDKETERMWLIVLEAVGALALLVFVIWWTMFSGRRGGELPDTEHGAQDGERGGNRNDKG